MGRCIIRIFFPYRCAGELAQCWPWSAGRLVLSLAAVSSVWCAVVSDDGVGTQSGDATGTDENTGSGDEQLRGRVHLKTRSSL